MANKDNIVAIPKSPDINFILDGRPLNSTKISPLVGQVIKFLDALPLGQLKSTVELSKEGGFSADTLQKYTTGTSIGLEDYNTKYKNLRVWGSKQSITALKLYESKSSGSGSK